MADGTLTIKVDLDSGDAEQQAKSLKDSLKSVGEGASSGTQKGISSVLGLGTAFGVASKVGAVAFNAIKSSISSAVSRVDTMNKFPKMMETWGYSTQQSEAAINKLADGIDGLPTTLDEVTSIAQDLTMMTGDIDQATDLTLALNDAFLASGSSTADASRGLQQFTQMLSTGTVDMQSWRTLMETMPVALQKVAESFGYAGASAKNDLYAALKSGEITFQDFSQRLIELDSGVGGFAEMAKINSEGIATSFGNIKNAIAKGVAGSIQALDELSQQLTGKSIAQNLDSLKFRINSAFNAINTIIASSAPVIETLISAFNALQPAIIAVTTAFVAFKVIQTASTYMQTMDRWVRGLNTALMMATGTTNLSTAAITADTVARLANQGILKASTLLYGTLTGKISLATAAKIAMTAATIGLKAAFTALTGPIGLAAAAIGAVVGIGSIFVKKWKEKKQATEEAKKENEEYVDSLNQVSESSSNTISKVNEERSAFRQESSDIKALADNVIELANKKNRTATETQTLKTNIESLNASVSGLNLKYDESTQALDRNAESINRRIEQARREEEIVALQEQLNTLASQRYENEQKLAESQEKMNRAGRQGKEITDEQVVAHNNLKTAQQELATEYDATSQKIIQLEQQKAESTRQAVADMSISFEELNKTQQSFVESQRSNYQNLEATATNAFSTISQNAVLSANQMSEILNSNAETMSQWADNIKILAERGMNQGLLQQLINAGPAAASQTAELVNMSAEEMANLNTSFETATQSAVDAMNSVLDSSGVELSPAIKSMITESSDTLRSEIESANFQEIGAAVPKNFKSGISESASEVETAGKEVAQKVTESIGTEIESADLASKGQEVPQKVAEGINTGSEQVQSAVEQVTEPVKNIGTELETVRPQVESFGTSFETLGTSATAIVEPLTAISTAIQEFSTLLTTTVESLTTFGTSFTVLGEQFTLFQSNITMLAESFTLFQSNMITLIESFTLFQTSLLTIGESLTSMQVNMQALSTTLMTLGMSLTTFSAQISLFHASLMILPPVLAQVTSSFNQFSTSLTMLTFTLAMSIGPLSSFGTSLNSTNNSILSATRSLSTFNSSTSQTIASLANLGANSQMAGTRVQLMGTQIQQSMTMASTVMRTATNQMIMTVRTAFNSILTTTRSGLSNMLSAIRSTGNQMVASIQNTMSSVNGTVSSGMSSAVGTINSYYGAFYSAGAYLVQGVAAGMNSAMGSVIAAANAIVAQAERAAKAAAKIHSPSRLFRDEVGRWIAEGIAVGITKNTGSVTDSLNFIRDEVSGFKTDVDEIMLSSVKSLSTSVDLKTSANHISKMISGQNKENRDSQLYYLLESISDKFELLQETVQEGQVIQLDGGAIVGGTINSIDRALGSIQSRKRRSKF